MPPLPLSVEGKVVRGRLSLFGYVIDAVVNRRFPGGWLESIMVVRREEDAFAEQGEAGAAAHLAFDHLDAVDVDRAGVPGQGEPVSDGVVIAEQAFGEGAEVWGAAGLRGADPVVEVVAGQLCDHLGELGHGCGADPG